MQCEIDFSISLMSGFFMEPGYAEPYVDSVQIRLCQIFYSCGKIGHIQSDCEYEITWVVTRGNLKGQQYGPWLKSESTMVPYFEPKLEVCPERAKSVANILLEGSSIGEKRQSQILEVLGRGGKLGGIEVATPSSDLEFERGDMLERL